MKDPKNPFTQKVVENLSRIIPIKGIQVKELAAKANIPPSTISKILSGVQSLSLENLSKIATAIGVSEINIIGYPDEYVKRTNTESDVKTILQIELPEGKKEQILRQVFGQEGLKIIKR